MWSKVRRVMGLFFVAVQQVFSFVDESRHCKGISSLGLVEKCLFLKVLLNIDSGIQLMLDGNSVFPRADGVLKYCCSPHLLSCLFVTCIPHMSPWNPCKVLVRGISSSGGFLRRWLDVKLSEYPYGEVGSGQRAFIVSCPCILHAPTRRAAQPSQDGVSKKQVK